VLASDPVEAVIDLVKQSGKSRFPVYEETLDQVVGVVTVINVLSVPAERRATTPVRVVAREPVLVPESLDLDGVLATMQSAGMDMAIVVDEYGGTDGVVTIEDLVEELVGEIADEHDPVDLASAAEVTAPTGVRTWLVDGVLRADELDELTGFRLPDGPYETLAGFLLARLGRIPVAGETVVENGWEFTVIEVVRRRVEQVRVVAPEARDD
jgi:CBS domain containing-hemolysin-like protein